MPLTLDRLKELLTYDPETGIFTHTGKGRLGWNNFRHGQANHHDAHGYVLISVDGHNYKAHRAAWLFVHGHLPDGHIDHINGVRDDNRLVNLRVASSSQNRMNSGRQRNNTSGYKGVSWNKHNRCWEARIQINKKLIWLGAFDDPAAAHKAYCAAAEEVHGKFARVA